MKKKLYLSFGLITISLCGPLRSAYDEISNPFTIQHSVGIGTETPQEKLHVNGTILTDGRRINFGATERSLYADTSYHYYLDSSDDTRIRLTFRDKQDTLYGAIFGAVNGAQFGLLDGDMSWAVKIVTDESVSFVINNSQKMIITNSGKVGIGFTDPDSTPSYKLQVAGVTYTRDGLVLGTGGLAAAGSIRYSGGDFQGHNGSNWVSLVNTDSPDSDSSVTNELISTVSVNTSTGNLEIVEAGATKTVALADIVKNASIPAQGDVLMGEFTN